MITAKADILLLDLKDEQIIPRMLKVTLLLNAI